MPDDARSRDDHAIAREHVLRWGWNAAAYQVLNPGMALWLPPERDAVVGYCAHGRWWVVAGAPICAEERLASVVRQLEDDAGRAGARVLYFGAGERLESLLAGRGTHHMLRLGAQPVWEASLWPGVVAGKASLRAQINRARNKGVRARRIESPDATTLGAMRQVLERWLGTRGLPPLHFMTEPDLLGDLRDRKVWLAETHGRTIAFLVATPVPARRGWLIEEWPRMPEAPNGTTQLLVDAAMRELDAAGAHFVTLGLAPLSDRAGAIGDGEPVWLRGLLRWVRAHGRRFYNFTGLDAFKASLEPMRWEPIYAITPGQRVTLGMLTAVAGVFGGGSPLSLVARALGMAVAREVRSLLS